MENFADYQKILDRHKNFFGDLEYLNNLRDEDVALFASLQKISDSLQASYTETSGLDRSDILYNIFTRVYNFVVLAFNDFKYFNVNHILEMYTDYENTFSEEIDEILRMNYKDSSNIDILLSEKLYYDIFDACLFASLCSFINTTKRMKGLTIKEFLYRNSKFQYNVKNTPNFMDYKYPDKTSMGYTLLQDEYVKFRQIKKRFYSEKGTAVERNQGSAITADLEHEMAFLYNLMDLDYENHLQNTYKRIGNLYNGVNDVVNSVKDDDYSEKLGESIKKITSKLKKINYKDMLELEKYIVSKIRENDRYYGINMYRFEKNLKIYRITHEVNKLISCKSIYEEIDILGRFVALKNIHFPTLYDNFYKIENYIDMSLYANSFKDFIKILIGSSRIIIDEFVEKGVFGEDWYEFFLKKVNEMTSEVFYDPSKIDYTSTPESQEKYASIILAPLHALYSQSCVLKDGSPD